VEERSGGARVVRMVISGFGGAAAAREQPIWKRWIEERLPSA
jgi:hypothetical protein